MDMGKRTAPDWIEFNIEEYCRGCPEFEVSTRNTSPSAVYAALGLPVPIEVTFVIECVNRRRCERLYEQLKGAQKVE